MSNLSTPKFELTTSLYLLNILLFTHGGAIICITTMVSMMFLLKSILIIGCVVSLMSAMLSYVFPYSSKAVVQFSQCGSSDSWKLYLVNGQGIDAQICGNSFIHPYCMILNFISEGGNNHYTAIILPGSLDDSSRRMLHKALMF